MIKRVDRADGTRYQVYGKRSGRKVYLGTYESRRAAQAADEDHRAKQRRIAAGELPPDHDERRTFGKGAELWLKALGAQGSRSVDEYEGRLGRSILPAFRDVPIVEIHRKEVLAWRDGLSARVSAGTVNALLSTLSSAFTWFCDQRWIDVNPCRRIKTLVRKERTFPWLQSSEQVTRLLAHCSPTYRTIYAVLVGTGMRLDEALHLHWDDVDLEHRLITVQRGRKGVPKSGKMRRIPILDGALPVLREMRLKRGENRMLWPGGKPGKRTGKALTRATVYRPFKLAVRRADLDPRMRVHDLRHSFASLFLLDGGDIFKLSRILGHSSVAVTERTYAHLRPDAYEADYGRVRFRMPSDGTVQVLVPKGETG